MSFFVRAHSYTLHYYDGFSDVAIRQIIIKFPWLIVKIFSLFFLLFFFVYIWGGHNSLYSPLCFVRFTVYTPHFCNREHSDIFHWSNYSCCTGIHIQLLLLMSKCRLRTDSKYFVVSVPAAFPALLCTPQLLFGFDATFISYLLNIRHLCIILTR